VHDSQGTNMHDQIAARCCRPESLPSVAYRLRKRATPAQKSGTDRETTSMRAGGGARVVLLAGLIGVGLAYGVTALLNHPQDQTHK